jgi:hypothetical protein
MSRPSLCCPQRAQRHEGHLQERCQEGQHRHRARLQPPSALPGVEPSTTLFAVFSLTAALCFRFLVRLQHSVSAMSLRHSSSWYLVAALSWYLELLFGVKSQHSLCNTSMGPLRCVALQISNAAPRPARYVRYAGVLGAVSKGQNTRVLHSWGASGLLPVGRALCCAVLCCAVLCWASRPNPP